MSITTIISYEYKKFKPIRTFLSNEFPKPTLKSIVPLMVEPGTMDSVIIGTAFDYLLRFNLEKEYKDKVFGDKWIAEKALKYFSGKDGFVRIPSNNALDNLDREDLIKYVEGLKEKDKQVYLKFDGCRKTYNQFINSELLVSGKIKGDRLQILE